MTLSRLLILFIFFSAACRSSYYNKNVVTQEPLNIDEQKGEATVVAGQIYEAGATKRFFLGDHYRDVWTAPVTVPIVDINEAKGGLELIEKGGGMQTKSLKLKGADGQLYSFRSIQKDPSSVLPGILEKTVADDIVQDQISAEHPYGAFILPILADAAGIYHTNPTIYFIPDTPALGKYQEDFGGMLVMLEEDADEDWSHYEDFGYTENAVSTESVIEELMDDNDNEVDQHNVLRNRLFDMWVGDWDRHEGQWRWAELDKKGKGKLYRPIPEDRDNVFFKFDGLMPWLASRQWALRKFQSFENDIDDIAGLNFNARDFDRRFLTDLSREDWIAMADTLQRRLTDEEINAAVNSWPDTIQEISGEEIASKLKARRAKLKDFASSYYTILAEEVNIHGSDKNEYFLIERVDDTRTKVTVYKSDDDFDRKKIIYERVFLTEETDDIRIYGFGEEDYFEMTGNVDKGINIRLIGGSGEDVFIDKSSVSGLKNKTKVYDLIYNTELEGGSETSNRLSESLDVNRYDFKQYQYNLLAPQLFFGYNIDDGIFLGGGVMLQTHGFRSDEYKTQQKFIANYAMKTGAYNFIYEGSFRNFFRTFDLDIDFRTRAPNFISNFYGLGNSTEQIVEDDDFYRYRRDEVKFDPGLMVRFGNKNYIKVGPSFRYNNVYENQDNFVNSNFSDIPEAAFDKNLFGGLRLETSLNSINNKFYPENGILWDISAGWYRGLYGEENSYSSIASNLNLYLTPKNFPLTLAMRFGSASIIGDYYFFQAVTLGGNSGFNAQGNLRGFRRDRFAGTSMVYQNTELRFNITDFRLYILPVKLGALLFVDHGRVWSDEAEDDELHRGYGGGLFIRPVGKFVLAGTYAISEEDEIINITLGFMF